MSYDERVVGFDCRLAPRGSAPRWDDERRAQYLLRDVPWPLSVDPLVWSRADESAGWAARFDTAEAARAARGPDEWAVAITQWGGPGEPPVAGSEAPDPRWERLGYDLAAGVSGLSNCGYEDGDRARFADFAAALNAWHLFDDLPTGFAFRDVTNRRVPEHAPFGVVGLYRV